MSRHRLSIILCVLLGAALTALPFFWFNQRIGPLLDAPGVAVSRFLGATDQLRTIDLVTYFLGGTLVWSSLLLGLYCVFCLVLSTRRPRD
jgi:hypothetical protein